MFVLMHSVSLACLAQLVEPMLVALPWRITMEYFSMNYDFETEEAGEQCLSRYHAWMQHIYPVGF